MVRHFHLALAALLSFNGLLAQTCDLVVFSEMGEKFTLMVDGAEINTAPATRVVATGIRNETPSLLVRFADANVPAIKQNGWFPLGKEYTMAIAMNKKGVRVLRASGEAELGTAKPEPVKPAPATFVEDAPAAPATDGEEVAVTMGGQTVTTTVVEETTLEGDDLEGENVNMSIGMNGMGVNMNVNVNGTGMGTTTTTGATSRTTTTTTTTTVSTSGATVPVATTKPAAKPATTAVVEPIYHMPGYNGPIGCGDPMDASAFNEAKSSISSKSFEDTKMTLVKQIGGSNCFTVDQVKQLMGLFTFEDNKLDLAKFAYDHTYDIGNYYKLSDAFTFESSTEELNEYIKSR